MVIVNSFRMPLDTKDGQFSVHDSLNAAIPGAVLNGCKSAAQFPDGLVVGAVHSGVFAVQTIEPGVLCDNSVMILIAIFIAMNIRGGKILIQSTAKAHIDDLESFADAKHGNPLFDAEI